MDALSDITMAREMLIDIMGMTGNITHPPLQAPASLMNKPIVFDSGGITYVDNMRDGKVEPVITTQYDVTKIQQILDGVEGKIRQAFSNDVFRMFSPETPVMTATQVLEMRQEKLSILGPVLERLQTEIFSPLIDALFDMAMEAGILPEMPDILEEHGGESIDIQYVSPLSMAQGYSQINSMTQAMGIAGQMAQFTPEVIKMLDGPATVRKAFELLHVPPEMLRSEKEFRGIMQAEAEQAQQAQQMQQMQQMAESASKVAGMPTDENHALGTLSSAMGLN